LGALRLGWHRLVPLQQRVAAERYHNPSLRVTDHSPSVATITAVMVCIRFPAWPKTIKYWDSKTSSVTSVAPSARRRA
jgi:hypothetical protein